MEALSGTIIRALLSIVVLFVFIRVVPPSEIINADYSRKRINVKQIILPGYCFCYTEKLFHPKHSVMRPSR